MATATVSSDGWAAEEAAEITGASIRQLYHWSTRGYVVPERVTARRFVWRRPELISATALVAVSFLAHHPRDVAERAGRHRAGGQFEVWAQLETPDGREVTVAVGPPR